MTIRCTNFLSLILSIAVVPCSIAQQEPSGASLQEMTVTAYRAPQSANDLPLSLSVIGDEELQLRSHTHIQESINRFAGVNFHRNDGQEYLAAVRSPVLTGAGSCGSLLTAEDGLSIRPVGFCNVNQLFEVHTESARQIELIRGPGTALFGSSSLHGVVNVRDVAQFDAPETIALEAGAYGYTRAKLSASTNNLGAALTLTSNDGYRDDSGYEQQKLSVKHRAELDAVNLTTRFTATNLNQETAGFVVGPNAYRDEALSRQNPNPEAFRDASAARLSTAIAAQDGSWKVQPYARYSSMEFLQHFLPGQPLEENGHYSLGLVSKWNLKLNDAVHLTTGVDLEYADSWLRQTQDMPTQGSAFLQATIPQGTHYDYEVTSTAVGPYAHLQWQLSESLELGFGARLERVEYRYDNLSLDGRTRDDGMACGFGGCRYSRPGDRNDSFNNFSPKLSLSYAPGENAMLYLNYSNGFRAPEITELYRLQRQQTVADLDSEEIDSLELGWRGRVGALSYDLAAFYMEKTNVILRDVDFFNVADGETDHRGLEVQISWDISEQLSLDANASYARHEYANNPGLSAADIVGNDIDTAPRHFGSMRLKYQPVDEITAELEWQHVGSYFTDPENLNSYEGHDIFNVRASWNLNQQWSASLRLNNLLDDRYAERADFTRFTGDRYFPGLPRRIYLGVQYSF